MFNFFKKKDTPLTKVPELRAFQDTLNKQQKAAMLQAICAVSMSKGDPHAKEVEYLLNTAKLLDFDLDDIAFSDLSDKGEEYLINILKTLSESQKEWLVWNLNAIAYVKGKATETEVGVAVNICNRIGITDDRYVSIINKTKNIMNKV